MAWGFCLTICLISVLLFATFLRLSFRLSPFYWLGYSSFALLWFPFAGLRTPYNKEAVSAAEEYARELAKDLEDMANIYEYEKLHEERAHKASAARGGAAADCPVVCVVGLFEMRNSRPRVCCVPRQERGGHHR